MSEWPAPRHPGDAVKAPSGGTDVVLGTTLGRRTADGESYLIDQTLLRDAGVAPFDWVASLPLASRSAAPMVNSYRVNESLAAAFERVMATEAGGVAGRLIQDAQSFGYTLCVVGGAVRDLVLGRGDKVNDLDMTGDAPSGLMHDLVYFSAIGLPRARKELRRAWLPRVNISASSVVHGYRLVPGTSKPGSEAYHFLEYAPFKERFLATDANAFLYGWDAETDYQWRDMTMNSLLYDPARKVILDPGGALDDLGITQRALREWDGSPVDETKIKLVPVDLPETVPASWEAKAVARIIKSVAKYPDAKLGGIAEWVDQHAQRLADLAPVDSAVGVADGVRGHLLKAFGVSGDDLIAQVDASVSRLSSNGLPAWFTTVITKAVAVSPLPQFRDAGSPTGWPPLGVAAVELIDSEGRCMVGRDLPSATESDPVTSTAHFSELVSTWDVARVQVVGLGLVTAFSDGETVIAPVDADGRVVAGGV